MKRHLWVMIVLPSFFVAGCASSASVDESTRNGELRRSIENIEPSAFVADVDNVDDDNALEVLVASLANGRPLGLASRSHIEPLPAPIAYQDETAATNVETAGTALDTWSRPRLSGDWGGARAELEKNGVSFTLDTVQTVQATVAGGRNKGTDWVGSVDLVVDLDFEKLGLWRGGFMKVFAEGGFGDYRIARSGTLSATNTDMLFPNIGEDRGTLTSFAYTQFLAEWFGVFLGKIETLGGDQNLFAHGRGKDQFLNLNMVINPVSLRSVPYSTWGGGFVFVLPDQRGLITLSALDSYGSPDELNFDDAFDDVALAAEATIRTEFFGLWGQQVLGATWSSRDFSVLDQDPRIFLPGILGVPVARSDDSWAVYYNFSQYLHQEQEDPTQGVGLFGRVGVADEDTNPYHAFFSLGVGGKGILPGRDADTFGAGGFYIVSSDEIPDILGVLDSGDGWGAEVFYNIEFTPWFHLTLDAQVVEPSLSRLDTAVLLGVRAKIDF